MTGEDRGTWRKEPATPRRLDSEEEIPGLGGLTVGDFWAWGFSDILNNALRGTFAEFLVGAALGVVEDGGQSGWDDFDLSYGGSKIEVKSSAYLQSWYQEKPSVISFDVGERGSWEATTNTWTSERRRSADCYVFCLYAERDRDRANVLDTAAWWFYVVPTSQVNEKLKNQGKAGLSMIESMTTEGVRYDRLKEAVDRALSTA